MSAPRVLLSGVVLSQPMGGVRRHNQELIPRCARRLRELGGELCVLEGARGLAFELPPGVQRLPAPVPAQPTLARATLEGPWLRRRLLESRARGRPFDLLHIAHLPVPRSLPVPFTLLLHDLKDLRLRSAPASRRVVARRVVRAAARRAARVLVVSEALRDELIEATGLDPARVDVVPNAADHFQPRPRERSEGAPLVVVGHVEPRKNLELLLRALALDPGLPPLVVAGAPKRAEDVRLRDLAAALGVSERVEFVGLLDDEGLARLYARAACVVFPSRREGFGIPALEAQRARVPLAVSRIAALLEVAGPSTPCFSPDDPAECARAVRAALAAEPEQLEAAAARSERYSWDAAAERMVASWSAAVAGGA